MPDKTAIPPDVLEQAKAMGLDESDLDVDMDVSKESLTPKVQYPFDSPAGETEKPPTDEEKKSETPEEKTKGEGESKDKPEPKTTPQDAYDKRDTKRQMKEIREDLSSLKSLMTDFVKAKPENKEEAGDEFQTKLKEFADANDVNAEGLNQLVGLITESVSKKLGSPEKLQALEKFAPVVENLAKKAQEQDELQYFETEWNGYLTEVKKQYPNASDEQILKAKTLMDEMAHNETYGWVENKHPAHSLDYVFFKEQQKFKDLLFSPKKKTAESGHLGESDDTDEKDDLDFKYEDLTPERAEKISAKLHSMYNKE